MATFALVDTAGLITNVIQYDGTAPFNPGMNLLVVPLAGVSPTPAIGWTYHNNVFTAPGVIPPIDPPVYVRLSTIRDRVTAAGKWDEFSAELDSLPSSVRWHLLTLEQGVAPDDQLAVALLTQIGLNPTEILAA